MTVGIVAKTGWDEFFPGPTFDDYPAEIPWELRPKVDLDLDEASTLAELIDRASADFGIGVTKSVTFRAEAALGDQDREGVVNGPSGAVPQRPQDGVGRSVAAERPEDGVLLPGLPEERVRPSTGGHTPADDLPQLVGHVRLAALPTQRPQIRSSSTAPAPTPATQKHPTPPGQRLQR